MKSNEICNLLKRLLEIDDFKNIQGNNRQGSMSFYENMDMFLIEEEHKIEEKLEGHVPGLCLLASGVSRKFRNENLKTEICVRNRKIKIDLILGNE